MSQEPSDKRQHTHDYTVIHEKGEKHTKLVLIITLVTMLLEISAGLIFGSMALLADGWHMGTHAAAFTITLFAYSYARKHRSDSRFTFGTGKVSSLGGFASAVALAVVALFMGIESLERFLHPLEIHFNEAIAVACLGLAVNLFCAFLLRGSHTHDHDGHHSHGHTHDHGHGHGVQDQNLRGAYLHVIADALTSVLAIVALFSGKFFGWTWLDPAMGVVGALLISRWSYGLLLETSRILLDRSIPEDTVSAIRRQLESDDGTRVTDLHVWKLGPADYAAVISLAAASPAHVSHYRNLLAGFHGLSHITIEVIDATAETDN